VKVFDANHPITGAQFEFPESTSRMGSDCENSSFKINGVEISANVTQE